MKRVFLPFSVALGIVTGLAGIGHAATVTNKGSETIVLVVAENGNRVEVPLDGGASENLCAAGCFLTLPNGDRLALDGGETVEIIDGSAVVK